MTPTFQRHLFLMTLAISTASVAVSTLAHTQALVDEKDAQAAALGYAADAKRVDTRQYSRFDVGQNCASGALYQRTSTDKADGLSAVCRQAGDGCALVQRMGQEGPIGRAVERMPGQRS